MTVTASVDALPVVLYQEKRNGVEKIASDGAKGSGGQLIPPLILLDEEVREPFERHVGVFPCWNSLAVERMNVPPRLFKQMNISDHLKTH